MNNTSAESYLQDGCGRCEHYKTPQCKVHRWTDALVELRKILLASALTEEMKWGSPCYTLSGKNVVMLTSFNDFCALSFFKGALLADEEGVLELPGPNTQHARLLKFTSAKQVRANRKRVRQFIDEATQLHETGAKAPRAAAPEPMPTELRAALDADAKLRDAFEALTPGRQRSHILHVSGAKQAKTRAARAERCGPKILLGKGWNER